MNPLADLFTGMQYVANMHTAVFNKAHPRAKAWTKVWAEVRHSYAPSFPPENRFRTALVVCEYNEKKDSVKERLLLAGTGESQAATITDLATQLRKEFPHVYDATAAVTMPMAWGDKCYPMGFLGPMITGAA